MDVVFVFIVVVVVRSRLGCSRSRSGGCCRDSCFNLLLFLFFDSVAVIVRILVVEVGIVMVLTAL